MGMKSKKLFLLTAAMLTYSITMRAESDPNDLTRVIVNAGFDEDLTFTTDGKYKEGTVINAVNDSLSERSWSYVHPDGSCFAHAKKIIFPKGMPVLHFLPVQSPEITPKRAVCMAQFSQPRGLRNDIHPPRQ